MMKWIAFGILTICLIALLAIFISFTSHCSKSWTFYFATVVSTLLIIVFMYFVFRFFLEEIKK